MAGTTTVARTTLAWLSLSLFVLLALPACTTDFGISGGDTSTDTAVDTGADTSVDTAVDTWEDTDRDTWEDPWTDPWEDTYTDPWVDPIEDSWVDSWTDPWTDTVTCEPWTVPAGGNCSQVDQCGCTGGSWCNWAISDIFCAIYETCVTDPPAGTFGLGAPCTDVGQCAPGLECLSEGVDAYCYQWCRYDSDCMVTGSTCSLSLGGISGTAGTACEAIEMFFPYKICTMGSTCADTGCSPFTAGVCGAGTTCTWDPFCDVTICTATGTLTEGSPCYGPGECLSGMQCLQVPPGSTPGTCVKFCNAVHTCSGSRTCTPIGSATHPDLMVCL